MSTAVSTPSLAPRGAMPPGFAATVGHLDTFVLPEKATGSVADQGMAKSMVNAWRRDGILQIGMSKLQRKLYENAHAANRWFMSRPPAEKQVCVDGQSYSGYIASGEEITDGIADYSEIFTVTKDLPASDERVKAGWPCHGPCPWPDSDMKLVIKKYMDDLALSGEKLLQLIELGLDIKAGSLTNLTEDGWHHLRILRLVFPSGECQMAN